MINGLNIPAKRIQKQMVIEQYSSILKKIARADATISALNGLLYCNKV
jgi:hypothetical protein